MLRLEFNGEVASKADNTIELVTVSEDKTTVTLTVAGAMTAEERKKLLRL